MSAVGLDLLRTRATVTVQEAAGLLGISPREVRGLIARGHVEATRSGKRLLLFAPSLLKYLESNRLPCRPEARVSNVKGGVK